MFAVDKGQCPENLTVKTEKNLEILFSSVHFSSMNSVLPYSSQTKIVCFVLLFSGWISVKKKQKRGCILEFVFSKALEW